MMSKQTIRVIIGHAVQLTAPGMAGRKFDFNPRHSFLTQEWFFPGEVYERRVLTGKLLDQWGFGTNTGTNLPLTFDEGDVREVVIPNDPETIKAFEGAPFTVTIKDR
jgi:hypothetical protein